MPNGPHAPACNRRRNRAAGVSSRGRWWSACPHARHRPSRSRRSPSGRQRRRGPRAPSSQPLPFCRAAAALAAPRSCGRGRRCGPVPGGVSAAADFAAARLQQVALSGSPVRPDIDAPPVRQLEGADVDRVGKGVLARLAGGAAGPIAVAALVARDVQHLDDGRAEQLARCRLHDVLHPAGEAAGHGAVQHRRRPHLDPRVGADGSERHRCGDAAVAGAQRRLRFDLGDHGTESLQAALQCLDDLRLRPRLAAGAPSGAVVDGTGAGGGGAGRPPPCRLPALRWICRLRSPKPGPPVGAFSAAPRPSSSCVSLAPARVRVSYRHDRHRLRVAWTLRVGELESVPRQRAPRAWKAQQGREDCNTEPPRAALGQARGLASAGRPGEGRQKTTRTLGRRGEGSKVARPSAKFNPSGAKTIRAEVCEVPGFTSIVPREEELSGSLRALIPASRKRAAAR